MDQIDAVEWGLKYLLTGPYLNELQKKSSGRNYKKSALNVLPAPGNCPGLKNCKWFSEDGADDPRHQVAGIWILDMTQAFKNWITVVLVITCPSLSIPFCFATYRKDSRVQEKGKSRRKPRGIMYICFRIKLGLFLAESD